MAEGSQARLVSGRAVLSCPLPEGAHLLRVVVEDVSRADAASVPAGRVVLPVSGPLPAGTMLPFEIPVGVTDPAARYSVRAHLDLSGNGRIEPGDLVSTQSYPVLTHGAPEGVEVRLLPA